MNVIARKMNQLKNFLTPANAGKEHTMVDANVATATPPATSGGLSKEDVLGIINTALGEALKPIGEALTALKTAATTPPATAAAATTTTEKKAAPLTAEDVSKIVGDSLKNFQQQQTESTATADYARTKLSDLPPTYQALLPKTADAAALAKAEQEIRARYKMEVGDKLAATAPPLNSNGGGQPAQGKIDVSKLTPVQKLEYSLTAGIVPNNGQSAAVAASAAAAK